MTTFYLIRHGSNEFVGRTLVGRTPGVHLNDAGRAEAHRLAERLADEPVQQIFSSPMERCRETIAPLAARLNCKVEILDALIEMDFGSWTGLEFSALEGDELWKQWNTFRSAGRIPNGESIWEVQQRMIGAIEDLRRKFDGQRIALVSHGDPLRAAIVYYLGMPLDFVHRIEIGPASASVLEIGDWSARLRCLNAQWGASGLRL